MSALLTITTKRQINRCFASTQKPAHCKSVNTAWLPQRRSVSDHGHFYRNRQLELYTVKEARRLTLRQLVRSPFVLLSQPSSKMKRIFLGLVWPLYDSRQVDQSEGRFNFIVAARVLFLMTLLHFYHTERKLCTNRVASSDITSSAGHASVTIRRREAGRGCQSLWGACSRSPVPFPHSLPRTRSLNPHTFFSYIGRPSKSEKERFAKI